MKICSRCKDEKDLIYFNKNKSQPDGYQRYCKPCKKNSDKKWFDNNPSVWKESNKNRNKKIKNLLSEFREKLGGKCKKCTESREHLLDFHHLNPKEKDESIYNILVFYGYGKNGINRAKNELDKCILLCSNCHRDFHFMEKENNLTIKDYLNGI